MRSPGAGPATIANELFAHLRLDELPVIGYCTQFSTPLNPAAFTPQEREWMREAECQECGARVDSEHAEPFVCPMCEQEMRS